MLPLECELTGLDCPWRSQAAGSGEARGAGTWRPQEGSVPAYHGGAELGASRTVGSITDDGQIGRTEQAGGTSGLQSETGCAGGRPC